MWFLVLLWGCCLALPPIVIKGNQLYNSETMERFYVKGVAYAPNLYANKTIGGTAVDSDPSEDHFTDEKEPYWSKDIPLLKALGINSIRLYNVDPGAVHEKFMAAAEAAGLYVVVSTTVPFGSGVFDAGKPASTVPGEGCYTRGLLYSAKEIVREFAKFNNTLAFMVANEIDQYLLNGTLMPGYHAMPCVKALVRDLREYMATCSCGMRYVPLMYAATDLNPTKDGLSPRDLISQYLTCGPDSVDLYGINVYTWCAYASTFSSKSTYKDMTDAYRSYDVGMLFSEFGCTYGQFESYYPFTDDPTERAITTQRHWKQIDTLFSTDMSDVYSGGFAYQYSMSEIIYGMVLLPGYAANQPNIQTLPNYNYAKTHFTAVVPPAQTATWTDSTLCTWKPPIFNSKVKNQCPNSSITQKLFGDEPENWSRDLPPIPPEVNVPCFRYPLTFFDQKENACRGPCLCPEIVPDAGCRVNWSGLNLTDPAISTNVSFILSTQCGLLSLYGGDDYKATCSKIDLGGKYYGCSDEEKTNYILGVWFQSVKQGGECCAPLFSDGTCKLSPPTSAPPTRANPNCGEIIPNPRCSLGPLNYSDPAVQAGLKRLMDQQCTYIKDFGRDFAGACSETKPSGRYEGCSQEQLADFVLDTWFEKIKGGAECCVGLFNEGGTCGSPAPSSSPTFPTPPLVPTAPTVEVPSFAPSLAPTQVVLTQPAKTQSAFPVIVVGSIVGGIVLVGVALGVAAFIRNKRNRKDQMVDVQYAALN